MYIFHYYNYYLPDFVTAICLGFIFVFSFLGICFNLINAITTCGIFILMRDQALSLWSGSTDSKTLDYQRTNPRKYQIVRTPTKETTGIQDPASPGHQCRTPHLNNKQNKIQTQSSADRIPPHSAFPSEEKQTKKPQHKSHLYKAYTNHWTNIRRAETKRRKEFNLEAWEKETSNTIS